MTPAHPISRARAALYLAAGALLTFAAAAALAELGLRAVGRPFKDDLVPSENALATFDPELGWIYRASFATEQTFGEPPARIPLAFNADRARTRTATVVLDPDRPSVLLVGGSFMMGHGVRFEDTVAGRLARPDRQVVNLAVQGYGTDQALLRLRRGLARFRTEAVVYGFICSHVRRNANDDRRLLFPGARFLGTKPRFALDGGALVLVDRPRRYSGAYSRLWAQLRVLWTHYGPPPRLALTRALAARMAEETRAAGARFMVVDWHMGREPAAICGEAPLAGLGLEVLRPADAPPAGWFDWIIPGDYHPDPRAHAYVTETVARALDAPAGSQ